MSSVEVKFDSFVGISEWNKIHVKHKSIKILFDQKEAYSENVCLQDGDGDKLECIPDNQFCDK